jgi:hypothetical protein
MKKLVFLAILTIGCSDGGPSRLRVQGAVTFDGAPIPYGDVLFTPDGNAGASGAQGIAPIRDGRYDSSNGQGIAGGPTVIRVTGLSGPEGPAICVYEMTVDLPTTGDITHDINVPKTAARKSKPGDP